MAKKGSISGQFAIDIEGYEELYRFIQNIFVENKWSRSSIRDFTKRFITGFRYDGISQENVNLDELRDRIYKIRKNQFDRQSKEYFINQYGENLGLVKFKELQEKQAHTNSKEYKEMTDEEFKEYNKSRACTLENLIKRHGEKEGRERWEKYVKRQHYTKSRQRYIDENRLDDYYEINKKKVNTLENYIKRHGKEEGLKRWEERRNTCSKFWSKIASELFSKVETSVTEKIKIRYNMIYSPKCNEYMLTDEENGRAYFYDFTIPELKYCIEFNGDLFHANPKLFCESDTPNPFDKSLTSEDIWKFDKHKNDLIIKNGFDLDIVWESEYKKDKEHIVNQIVDKICNLSKIYCNSRDDI
jgi:hypothetical protein